MPVLVKENVIDKLKDINWDFNGEKTQYLTHKFHSYPARFIPQIPKQFIEAFTDVGDTVLDPMCGSGTTLVEAMLAGRNAIGNDYNPLSVLISKVKTTIIQGADFKYLGRQLELLDIRQQTTDNTIKSKLPNRKLSKLFTRKHLNSIASIKQVIEKLKRNKKSKLYDFCLVALSSTIWSFIEGEGKADIVQIFKRKIELMKKELLLMKNSIPNPQSSILLQQGDARSMCIDSGSVDLIVTSPPYVNALDYYREHMYNMFFLDIDIDRFKKNEIGGHSHFISNRFRLLGEYLGDMLRAMIEMNRVLKKDKYCAIVVGNSSLEYELIESYKHFISFASLLRFKHEVTFFRNIDKTRKYTSKEIGQIDDEYIVVLRKQSDSKVDVSDKKFVAEVVRNELCSFKHKVGKSSKSSFRGKVPTQARLKQNLNKITQAIDFVPLDIER